MARKYEAFLRESGITCDTVKALPPEYLAWVSQPEAPWAFGKFLCACLTMKEAERIAETLNEVHHLDEYYRTRGMTDDDAYDDYRERTRE